MDNGANLTGGGADQNQNPSAFDAAAGGAAAGSDECEHHQQHFRKLRPQLIVIRRKAGGGHDGRYLKRGVANTVAHRPVHIPDIPRDGGDGHGHHNEEKPQLVTFQRLADLAGEGEEVDGEVNGEQQHKHSDDNLNGRASKGPH